VDSKKKCKIGLLGPYGFGNLGDAAIQQSMIENLRRRNPEVDLYGLSQNPKDTQERHNIPAFPIVPVETQARIPRPIDDIRILRFLWRLVRRIPLEIISVISGFSFLKDFDALIISGGGQLDDYWGGAFSHPYTLLKWGVLARLRDVKFMVVSVGAGPLSSKLSKIFTRFTLSLACYRSYRDEDSKVFLEKIGFSMDDPVFPDLAFSLPDIDSNRADYLESGVGVVGIGPMSYFHPDLWPEKDMNIYTTYLSKLVDFAAWLIQKNYKVMLFPGVSGTDDYTIAHFMELLKKRYPKISGECFSVPSIKTVNELTQRMADAEIIVASRFHGILTALLMNRPVLALSYHRKDDVLMQNFKQDRYCLSIDDFSLDQLKVLFQSIVDEKHVIKREIMSITTGYQKELELQYEKIFGEIGI
jgi:polysaccharide pyruvyl transferase WcaK-like protein